MLKKVGVAAAAAIGLSFIAAPAMASADPISGSDVPDVVPGLVEPGELPTFGDAYNTIVLGGGALGTGAASLVAGAYTGIATTPALIADSLSD